MRFSERFRATKRAPLLQVLKSAVASVDADSATALVVADAATEMSWWYMFDPRSVRSETGSMSGLETAPDRVPGETYVRPGPKIGRNDPCPCGSGRKYKKCHGAA